MSALSSNSDALYIPLSYSNSSFNTLVDSGSTHCFLDSSFASSHSIPLRQIPPIPLRLFDGSAGLAITSVADLCVAFPCGKSMSLPFYITKLDTPAEAVLGYEWMVRYNPLIDWVSKTLTFQNPDCVELLTSAPLEIQESDSEDTISELRQLPSHTA